jgi:hypothetical protein
MVESFTIFLALEARKEKLKEAKNKTGMKNKTGIMKNKTRAPLPAHERRATPNVPNANRNFLPN